MADYCFHTTLSHLSSCYKIDHLPDVITCISISGRTAYVTNMPCMNCTKGYSQPDISAITNKTHVGNVGNHVDILAATTDNDLFRHPEQIQCILIGGVEWQAKLIHFVWHGESPADIVIGQHVVSTKIPVDGWDFVAFLFVGGNAAHAFFMLNA